MTTSEFKICIPYYPGNLGKAYNNIMKDMKNTKWVLFIDHDVLLITQNWYTICLNAIQKLESNNKKIGWISGVTNSIGAKCQKPIGYPHSMDIIDHMRFSNKLYAKEKNNLISITGNNEKARDSIFSGMFILTNKKAWEDVGGFEENIATNTYTYKNEKITVNPRKFYGIDSDYFLKLAAKGYENFLIPSLYMYHIYKDKKILITNGEN